MARRAGACANPIAPEQRAHNEVANSSQLPQRPDSEFNMKSNLELSLEASSPTSNGSYEPQDLPSECDRRASRRQALAAALAREPRPRSRLPFEP